MREKADPELIGLVIDEIERFSKMTSEERREISRPPDWPLIYQLPHPQGGEITCGKVAHVALSNLSGRIHQADKLVQTRCSKNAAFQIYRKHFLKSLLKATVDGEIDEVAFAENYSKAIRRLLRSRLREHKFGVPCVLPIGSRSTKSYVVGPVEFIPTDLWIKGYAERFPAARPLDEGFKGTLNWFPWIAFVSVKQTEPDRGQRIANIAVDAAINIIRVFLVMAGQWPEVYRLGHAGGRLPPKTNCGISFEGDMPSPWYSRQSHPYVGDDFVEFLEEQDCCIQMLAGALRSTTDGTDVTHAGSRFLDALKWFGEACLEGQNGAQIVKAVMCLERLVIFKSDEGGLKDRVSKRVAALASKFGKATYRDAKDDLALAYAARSDLMHGAAGPMEDAYGIAPYKVLQFAAQSLFCFAKLVMATQPEKRNDAQFRLGMQSLVEEFEAQLV